MEPDFTYFCLSALLGYIIAYFIYRREAKSVAKGALSLICDHARDVVALAYARHEKDKSDSKESNEEDIFPIENSDFVISRIEGEHHLVAQTSSLGIFYRPYEKYLVIEVTDIFGIDSDASDVSSLRYYLSNSEFQKRDLIGFRRL